MMKTLYASVAAIAAVSFTAAADEVWSTEIGDVIYERDLESGAAVLSYPLDAPDQRGLGYVEGLAGQYVGRGAYSGVWVEPTLDGEATCKYALTHPETGEPVFTWGRLEMVFVDPDFPGSWVMKRGFCFDDPEQYLVGKPIVAASE